MCVSAICMLFHSLQIVIWLIKRCFLLPALQHKTRSTIHLLTLKFPGRHLPDFIALDPFALYRNVRRIALSFSLGGFLLNTCQIQNMWDEQRCRQRYIPPPRETCEFHQPLMYSMSLRLALLCSSVTSVASGM